MKRITLLLVISVCTIFGVLAEKLYLKQDGDVNYMSNDAFVAVWCWGGVSSNWGIFTQVPNEPTLAVADIPNGTTGIKIVRFAASVTTPDWNSEIWNKTGDISKPTDQNTITLNAWDNATGGTWSNYISVEPSVEFTLSEYYLLTETVTLMATAENVTNPIYIYSVKQGESEYTILEGNTWTPSVAGMYTFKVEVKESTSDEIVASAETNTTIAMAIPVGTKLYLKPNANWKQVNDQNVAPRFAAYFFYGNNNTWVDMTKLSDASEDIYEVNVPDGTWVAVIFCRMHGNNLENNWENKWNQTNNLTYDGINNFYTVEENTWDKGNGSWSLYEEEQNPTAIEETSNAPLFTVNGRTLNVSMDNEAEISIYTISGQMIEHTVASNLTREMQQGVYVVRIGNQSQKLVIF